MERMRQGDRSALDELLRRYWGQTVAHCAALLGDWEAAEDVAQETFFWVWEHPVRWRPEGSAAAFVYKIARHRALDRLKWLRVRARRKDEAAGACYPAMPSPNPLELVEHAELRALLDRAVASLPPRRREIFTLGYLHELSHKEIAEIMEISLRTVKNQMTDALAHVRRTLRPLVD